MSKRLVSCIATSWNRAEQILNNLRAAQFPNQNLSVVFSERSALGESGVGENSQPGQWGVTGAAQRGVEEVALALPSELGILTLAGDDRFTAAGPLLEALGGVNNGATEGDMAASLFRLGVPLFEAQQYESRMKNGNIVLAVHLESPGDAGRAKRILSDSYGENICIIDLALTPNGPSSDHSPKARS